MIDNWVVFCSMIIDVQTVQTASRVVSSFEFLLFSAFLLLGSSSPLSGSLFFSLSRKSFQPGSGFLDCEYGDSHKSFMSFEYILMQKYLPTYLVVTKWLSYLHTYICRH